MAASNGLKKVSVASLFFVFDDRYYLDAFVVFAVYGADGIPSGAQR